MHLCTLIFIYSYIAFYIHISLYHLYIISFMCFYKDLAIHVLSIFLSCMLLLIHIFISYTLIFIYFPIHASTVRCFYTVIHILFHITYSVMPLLCLSFVYMCSFLCFVIFYLSLSFLSFKHFYHVSSMFHHILFGMSIIYSYHIILYSYHIHVFLFLYESTLLRNWNHSNRIIQIQVMTFSCPLVILLIFILGTV